MSKYGKSKRPTSKHIGAEFQSAFGYLRRQIWTNPIGADADRVLNDQATSDSVVTTVSSFLAQPDVPRNITVTPGGTTADVPAGDITITGTNIRDEIITEAITLTANQSTIAAGAKAFKTVTEIEFPVQDGAAATYDVGIGDKLGLDRKMVGDEVLYATVDGVYETTRPTVAGDSSNIEGNTADLNTALDGTQDIVVAFVPTEKTYNSATTS